MRGLAPLMLALVILVKANGTGADPGSNETHNLHDGDMLLTDEQIKFFFGDGDGIAQHIARDPRWFWPKGILPYAIDNGFDRKGINDIKKAVEEFNTKTCIKLVPRRSERSYVNIKYDPYVCGRSAVGRVGWRQNVIVGENCVDVNT